MRDACFIRKRTGCAVVQHPTSVHIYHHPGWGAGPTTTGPGKVNSRDCQGSHASGQGGDEDDGIHWWIFSGMETSGEWWWMFFLDNLFWDIYIYNRYLYNIYLLYIICIYGALKASIASWLIDADFGSWTNCWHFYVDAIRSLGGNILSLCLFDMFHWLYFCIFIISLALCQVYPFSHTLIERKPILEGPMFHWTMIVRKTHFSHQCWCISPGKAWGGDAEDIKMAAEPWSLQSARNSRRRSLEKTLKNPT